MIRVLTSKWAKGVVFVLGLVPFMWLVSRVVVRDLTANPIEYMTHFTGDWAIRFLLIALCVTPLRMLFKKPALTRFRRMLGLYSFFYACVHLLIWLLLDQQLDVAAMVEDVVERKYITVGMAAFLAMVPLAITSTAGWVRRLGYRRWQKLHRLVYFSAAGGVIHYYWLVKSDVREPLLYGAILLALLAVRLPTWLRKPQPAAKRSRAAAP
ncbi:MAG TPA: protein-methionine-sulfoxide reductase heme-binding subunit MsrQ, partial [Gammaproteobacteria bacterium]|nr:protein-methionine-sulfoxide reductase heme-binding subunit MsrQ [Gammaproteobacteria bacterium]